MPQPVQSSNISNLCAQLGFNGEYPGREEKVLTAHTLDFPTESLHQGTPIPLFKADSSEAQELAIKFCSQNQRGQLLWPENKNNAWPSWSSDKSKILQLVAHILSLQALYKYQKRCRDRKKQQARESSPMETGAIPIRELSPESRILVGPSPPKGTRRRPAKANTIAVAESALLGTTAAISVNYQPDAHTLASYIEHVESLDPKDDEQPLYDFNQRWLERKNAAWPTSADSRLSYFMHINNFYDPTGQEDKRELACINNLRHDTEIAEVNGQPLLYNELRARVLERVCSLKDEMIKKKFLTYNGQNRIQMVNAFREVWNEREDYWEKKRTSKTVNTIPTLGEGRKYKTPELFDDDEDDCVPVALKNKNKRKAKQPIKQQKIPTPKIPVRRKADFLMDYEGDNSHAGKRARTETLSAATKEADRRDLAEVPEDTNPELIESAANEYPDEAEIDAETAEHVSFAQGFLTTEIPRPRPSALGTGFSAPDLVPLKRVSSLPRTEPMTPESPAEKIIHDSGNGEVESPLVKSSSERPTRVPSRIVNTVPTPAPLVSTATRNKPFENTSLPVAQKTPPSRTTRLTNESPKVVPHSATGPSSTSAEASNTTPPSKPTALSHQTPKSNPHSATRLSLSSPATTTNHAKQSWWSKISMTLQKSDSTFDFDNEVSGDYLRALDLSTFFAFFSQRSGVPLSELQCLTLKLNFGGRPPQIFVVGKEIESEEWGAVKGKIRKFFEFVRGENEGEKRFYVWIEIGDRREARMEVDEEED